MTVALVAVAIAGLAATTTVAVVTIRIIHRWASDTTWTLAAEIHALRQHKDQP